MKHITFVHPEFPLIAILYNQPALPFRKHNRFGGQAVGAGCQHFDGRGFDESILYLLHYSPDTTVF